MSMHQRLRSWIGMGLLASMVVACGQSAPPPLAPLAPMPAAATANQQTPAPAAPKSAKSSKPAAQKPAATKPAASPKPGASPKPAAKKPAATKAPSAAEQAKAFLADIKTASEQTQNFVAQASTWSLPVGGGGKKETTVVRFTFAKPNQTAIEVLQSSKDSGTGAKIVWQGGDKASVRAKVLGMPVKIDLPISDSRLINQRGYTFADTAIDTWFASMLDPQAQVRVLGKMTLPNGREGLILEVKSSRMKPGITKEIYGVDSTSYAPLLCQMYEGETCVYEVQVKSVDLNVQLSADAFQT